MDNHTIIDRLTKKKYDADISYDNSTEQSYIRKDYAVIINCLSPFSEEKRLIICAGCRASGTLAAGEYLAKIHKISPLSNQIKSALKQRKSYAILICLEGYANSAGEPKVIDFKSFFCNT